MKLYGNAMLKVSVSITVVEINYRLFMAWYCYYCLVELVSKRCAALIITVSLLNGTNANACVFAIQSLDKSCCYP